jgi:hypothetical protein
VMRKRSATDVGRAIEEVERRIEMRRARVIRDATELKEAARDRAKSLPLVGVAALTLVGFALARGRSSSGSGGAVTKAGLLTGLVALVQAALRVWTSPLGRRMASYAQRGE